MSKIYDYVINNEVNKNVLKSVIEADGSEGGGGGSSDFSTAEVTINISNAPAASICIASIDEELEEIFVNEYPEEGDFPVTLTVPLYKGKCEILVSNGVSSNRVTVTGSIEFDSPYAVITGNGTIEITGTTA